MAELHVRNLPTELHERLRELAASEGRSMSSEAVVLLRQALQLADDQPARQREAIERLRDIRQRNQLPPGTTPAEQLVRGDRDAAR